VSAWVLTRYCDFFIYKMVVVTILNYRNPSAWLVWPISVIMQNFIEIGQMAAKILQFNDFRKSGCRPSWIFRTQNF